MTDHYRLCEQYISGDGLPCICEVLDEHVADFRELLLLAWVRDSHAVRFNKAHDDLSPHARVAKWIQTVEV